MALKIKFRMPTRTNGWASLAIRIALILVAACAVAVLTVGGYYYVKYQHIVDERLKQPLFKNTAKIYAEPREVRPGQKLPVRLIAAGFAKRFADGHVSRKRRRHHCLSRPAVLSRAGQRHHSRERRRGRFD